LSAQVGYVYTGVAHLQTGLGNNNVTTILAAGSPTGNGAPGTRPFPDFAQNGSYQQTIGRSSYSGLQTKVEQQFASGLGFLFAYTYSKTLSDSRDLLNGGSLQGYRAPAVPGLGPKFDWGPADFDLRNVFHFSGGYELPFGKEKRFLANSGKITNSLVGGWSVNWLTTWQGGQPITFRCPAATTAGTNCNQVRVAGQSQRLGLYKDGKGRLNWIGNPKAFQQPCPLGASAPSGCIPASGTALLGGGTETLRGPPLRKFDFSAFKNIPISERFSMQFRAEFFNILNHPNFNSPNFGGNGVVAISGSNNFTNAAFGEIGSTRFAPYDPRQIQFALKLYY
jgi:hypothetical protein